MLKYTFPDPHVTAATTFKSSPTQLPDLPELSTFPVIRLHQTHGANCAVITEHTTATVLDTDAVLTTLPDLVLVVKSADCLPILLWHPSGIIGALHAGRQGTNQKILKKTLRLLQTQFGLNSQLQLVFGPGICSNCYTIQLNPDVHYDLVKQNLAQVAEVFSPDQVAIQLSSRCTAHEPNHFHSYRRDGKGVPMNYTVICRTASCT